MNLHEPETQIQLAISLTIMLCVLVGTYTIFSMNGREDELLKQVKAMSVLNELQARQADNLSILNDVQAKLTKQQAEIVQKQAQVVKDQGETNRNLTEEISEIRKRQDILRRVAERIGIDTASNHEEKKKNP